MKILFVTTQSLVQSTLIGRVMPLAEEFQKIGNEVKVLIHSEKTPTPSTLGGNGETLGVFPIGPNPFQRTEHGKKRKSGVALVWTTTMNALRAAWQLVKIKPNVIIIVKPLPENTLAVKLVKPFLRHAKIILDVDDFELEANQLTSLLQRAAIHWSERVASKMASHIIVATPFLGDHMQLLAGSKKPVTLIPTGLPISSTLGVSSLTPSVFSIGLAKHTILFAGSLSISSGHRVDLLPEILLYVRKSIPNAQIIIAGSGDDEHTLRERFAKLHLQDAVTWHGRFTLDDIASLVIHSSVLIDPIDASIANRAKSSFRVALALTYGVPIVTSNIGIRTMMIPQELQKFFFAKPGDAYAYAEKIIDIFKNPITSHHATILTSASRQYQYDHLAKMYYNCIV